MVVRKKLPARLLRCDRCGFMFIENPTWLEEAYAEPINRSDTGYVWRNLWSRNKVCALIEASRFAPDKPFLDYAAGYGLFVRLMRDCGYDFQWADMYCQNLFSRGFEATLPLVGPFEAVTAFEVLEHLLNPLEEIERILELTSAFIFSTTIVPDPVPRLDDWPYYGLEHGQHIAFYTHASLEYLASKFHCELTSTEGVFHVLSRKPIVLDTRLRKSVRWFRFWDQYKQINFSPQQPLTMPDHNRIVREAVAQV